MRMRGVTLRPSLERFPLAECRERWLGLLGLEHETLLPIADVAREGEELHVWRDPAAGRPIAQERVPRTYRAALFLQAAAAAAFFAAHGFALTCADFDEAAWDLATGSPRLWLRRTPESMCRDGRPAPVATALASFLRRLFAGGGRLTLPAARALFEQLTAPDAVLRRADFWVAGALRTFPELTGRTSAAARQRCLGIGGEAVRTPRARSLAEKMRVLLLGGEPRVFDAGASSLAPGGALRLAAPASSVAEACRRLREEVPREVGGRRPVWIAVEPERWDELSRRAFAAARLALGDRVDTITIAPARSFPETPDEWRRALWIPCGTVAASIRFYESFAQLARHDPAGARRLAGEILASSDWADFAADPTGDAPLPAVPARRPPPRATTKRIAVSRRRMPAEDPGRRVERLLDAGQTQLALREAEHWVREFPERSAEAWFPLAARLSAEADGTLPPWLEAIEAEREIAGGRPGEAKARLERIARAPASTEEERRRAALRLAEVAVVLGHAAEGARRAAAWRRGNPAAPAGEHVRALRLGAWGLAREGRTDCALALLDEADRAGSALSIGEHIETTLSRARVHALAGRFADEAAIYDTVRPTALAAGDDRVAARFLAQEARGLLDRRDYARALVRLEEALAVSRDDPGERAALLLDLATTLYHAGQPERCEALLAESLEAAAVAGREDLARIARGNRIELLINRCAWNEALSEIASLERSARRERDDPRLLVALHHRSRLCLRRGDLAAAARDNAEARRLAERLGDRLEIGELWLEDGDRRLYEGDVEGAERAWRSAAEAPPDRCESDGVARTRLEELAWRDRAGPPAEACAELERLFSCDAYRAAEACARWRCLFGDGGLAPEIRSRAERVLRAAGGDGLADRIFGCSAAAVSAEALREIRGDVSAALAGEPPNGAGALERLGIAGLAVRDSEGRELVRLGTPPPESETRWRPLEAGSARFELALWPPSPGDAGTALALILETLLFRAPPAASASDFADGWRRLGIVTSDASMEEPYRRLLRFGPQPVTVLVLGESGSGKEAVARAVHRLSSRSSGPFVAVNVPAIPPALVESELFGHARGAFTGAERDRRGLLEEAEGGTIFFDEIGDLAVSLQSKLLRTLQEREFRRVGENRARAIDVRVVSATSRDLAKEVEAGRFREDLYYRLHVALIRLPALSERGGDAVRLARHFLEVYAREYGRGRLRLAPEAGAAISSYPWPGNVRELQNAMAQAAALCDSDEAVTLAVLPEPVRRAREPAGAAGDYRSRVDAHRRDLIADALRKAGGNRSRAARDLGLSRQALLYLMRELQVSDGPRPARA